MYGWAYITGVTAQMDPELHHTVVHMIAHDTPVLEIS